MQKSALIGKLRDSANGSSWTINPSFLKRFQCLSSSHGSFVL